nr:hypothetical protein 97 - kidney bean mitochondrion [Phaseolus vulgaris]
MIDGRPSYHFCYGFLVDHTHTHTIRENPLLPFVVLPQALSYLLSCVLPSLWKNVQLLCFNGSWNWISYFCEPFLVLFKPSRKMKDYFRLKLLLMLSE